MANNNIKFKDSHSEFVYMQKKIREKLLLKEQEMKTEDFVKKFDNEIKENIQDIKNNIKPIGTIKGYKYIFTPNQSNKEQLKDVSMMLTTSIDNQDITIEFRTDEGDSANIKTSDTLELTDSINQFLDSVKKYYSLWKKYWSEKTNDYNNSITQPTV